ncbi:hypothetical protein ACJ7VE_01015 [Streptomyces sp. PB17]|uniref:hypothetical protein n=1 Tax=Streptomyces sp. PB17 TaxID=3384158 RepID=UPI0038B48B71
MQRHTFRPDSLRRLSSVDEIEAVVGRPAAMITRKQIGSLYAGCRAVLAHSPIAAFGHLDADGTARTTFVGGAPGFARVHSPRRFSFPAPGPRRPSWPCPRGTRTAAATPARAGNGGRWPAS